MRLQLILLAVLGIVSTAHADEPAPRKSGLALESFEVGIAGFSQDGHGYQSQAAPAGQPGSERLEVFEPQLLAVFTQGPRLTHRIWIPIDIVTAASPNAMDKSRPVDMISKASRQNEAGTVAWDAAYAVSSLTTASMRNALHLEEDFRSWTTSLGYARNFAQDNTTLTANASHTYDWFDHLDYTGIRHGRTNRATTNGSASFTQVLSTTTVVHVNYGITAQSGELGNTWNAVPIAGGTYGEEILPGHRFRHALVGRFAQWLPWNGALKGFYRFYVDDWGIVAHTVEGQLLQRLSPFLYVQAGYRYHTQTGADFFTISAADDGRRRTADSDLAPLHSNSFSFGVHSEFLAEPMGVMEVGASFERYVRSNDLSIDVGMLTTGFKF